jgi:hypothetical protein
MWGLISEKHEIDITYLWNGIALITTPDIGMGSSRAPLKGHDTADLE